MQPSLDPHNKRNTLRNTVFRSLPERGKPAASLYPTSGTPLGCLRRAWGTNTANVLDVFVITNMNVTTPLKKMLTTR